MALTNQVSDITKLIRGMIHDQLRKDGRDSYSYDNDNKFALTEDFISEPTIKVFIGTSETTSFTYDSDTNRVTVTASLNANDMVIITYDYYMKYSDAEIKGYLESALSYFPQHQYKKVFEVDDTDEVVAINDSNPTAEEIYVIATVTSILIDPQNIKISIPDLTQDARREESDQDQIKKVIRNFTAFVGNIDFEDIQNHLSE